MRQGIAHRDAAKNPPHPEDEPSAKAVVRYSIASLRPQVRPFRLHWFPRLRSTNDHAAVLRRRGELFAPSIILTGHQLAGRGRGGNTWWSGPGSLTVTFAIAANNAIAPHQVPLLAGLAVRSASAEITANAAVQLKWPNDVLFEGRKLAGLLCERLERVDLIGLGLNVNMSPGDVPRGLRDRVISLSQIVHRPLDQSTVLATVAGHLHRYLSRSRRAAVCPGTGGVSPISRVGRPARFHHGEPG